MAITLDTLPRRKNSSQQSRSYKILTFGKATQPYVTGFKTRGWQNARVVSKAITDWSSTE